MRGVRVFLMMAISWGLIGTISAEGAQDENLYDFTTDNQGWILQQAERYDNYTGGTAILDYTPFVPEGRDDLTEYPDFPGTNPPDAEGAFQVGLALRGVYDDANPQHRWFDAVYVQSEDWYTHAQSGWPAGYEQHPDYSGSWTYGHYPIGAVAENGDYIRLRVYCPGFTHVSDPIVGKLYTRSGAGWTWVDSGDQNLERGWNVLRFPVSSLADANDVRELGVKLGSSHGVWGDLFIDDVIVGDEPFAERLIYMTPDMAYISQEPGYETRTVSIYYDDGGGATPGIRGFSLVVDYPQDCVAVTAAAPGDLLGGTTHWEWEDDGDRLTLDWVVLGPTAGCTGFGKLATITFVAADAGSDCCAGISFVPAACRFRDRDNIPITNLYFVDGKVSHDITPPADPAPVCTSHPSSGCYSNPDVVIDWAEVADSDLGPGHCAVGMRGYYLLLDTNPTTAVDASNADWFEPHFPGTGTFSHTYAGVGDGTYYVHLIGYDWLWNKTAVAHVGPICVDTEAPGPVAGLNADVTDEANLSVDLVWTNPSDPDVAGVEIYRMGTAGIAGSTYPEYDDDAAWAAPPAWPATRAQAIADGWTLVGQFTGNATVDPPAVRDFYYYVAFAYDTAVPANYGGGDAGGRDASLAYWLGDFDGAQIFAYQVDFMDVMILSQAYNEGEGDPNYNNICDIGPTVDWGRKSLPTTDNMIEFEDLIILAMNYEYAQGKRDAGEPGPIAPAVQAKLVPRLRGDELTIAVVLAGGAGLKGAAIELGYAPGVEYLGATAGDFWADAESFFLDAPGSDVVSLDCVALSGAGRRSGTHAVARFRVADPAGDFASAVWIARVRARDGANRELGAQIEALPMAVSAERPFTTALCGATPNPASRTTEIAYALGAPARVEIRVYDSTGRLARVLVDETLPAGAYAARWDGLQSDGSVAPAGVYFCRMRAGEFESTRKLMRIN
jgi:hypothetical protein